VREQKAVQLASFASSQMVYVFLTPCDQDRIKHWSNRANARV